MVKDVNKTGVKFIEKQQSIGKVPLLKTLFLPSRSLDLVLP